MESSYNDFISNQKSLLLLEHTAEEEENSKLLTENDPKILENLGYVLLNIKFKQIKLGLYGRTILTFTSSQYQDEIFHNPSKNDELYQKMRLPKNKMSSGDSIGIFFSLDSISSGKPILSGLIYKMTNFKISIAIEKDQKEKVENLENGLSQKLISLALMTNEITYQRQLKALERVSLTLNKSDHPSYFIFKEIILSGPKENNNLYNPSIKRSNLLKNDEILVYKDKDLNDEQQLAIKKALMNESIFLIHGPPGTGKTKTLCELIYQAVKIKKMKVLACGPSNISVDNMVERLSNDLKVCRIGNPVRMLPQIINQCLDCQIHKSSSYKIIKEKKKEQKLLREKMAKKKVENKKDAYRKLREIEREIKSLEKIAIQDVLTESDVILCTNTTADDKIFRKCMPNLSFDLLVIDEAAQSLELSCYIPMLRAKKVVLGGDHKQLPPTIKSKEADKKGLSITLFDRMMSKFLGKDEMSQLLRVQYRMNEKIMQWSSSQVYDGLLIADKFVANRVLQEDFPVILFMDTNGCGMGESKSNTIKTDNEKSYLNHSKCNQGEADLVLLLFEELYSLNLKPSDIGIITPYNAQVDLIKSLFEAKKWDICSQIEISSVDGFQGREKEAIIISMVRCNSNKEIGFLSEYRRMNVAITRSKKFVGIIGDSETLKNDKFLCNLIEYFKNFGDVRSAMEFQGHPEVHFNCGVIIDKSKINKLDIDKKTKVKKKKIKKEKNDKNLDIIEIKKENDVVEKIPIILNEEEPIQIENDKNKEKEENDIKFIEEITIKLNKFILDNEKDNLKFPKLNSYQRMKIHEIAESLGLLHISEGSNKDRQIIISKKEKLIEKEKFTKKEKIEVKPKPIKKNKIKTENKIDEIDDMEFLDQMIALNNSCNFYNSNKVKCENNVKLMGIDCQFCHKKYCGSHGMAEIHGCGDKISHYTYVKNKEKILNKINGFSANSCKPEEKEFLKERIHNKLTEKQKERGKKIEEKKK